jgi:hypothetical protein
MSTRAQAFIVAALLVLLTLAATDFEPIFAAWGL